MPGYRTTTTDGSGRFHFDRLPTGDYRVFASDEADRSQYEAGGTAVRIVEGTTANADTVLYSEISQWRLGVRRRRFQFETKVDCGSSVVEPDSVTKDRINGCADDIGDETDFPFLLPVQHDLNAVPHIEARLSGTHIAHAITKRLIPDCTTRRSLILAFESGNFAKSVFIGFQIVVSFECFGQSGNSMPSASTISQPQHTVLYTPNFLFSSPLVGILPWLLAVKSPRDESVRISVRLHTKGQFCVVFSVTKVVVWSLAGNRVGFLLPPPEHMRRTLIILA